MGRDSRGKLSRKSTLLQPISIHTSQGKMEMRQLSSTACTSPRSQEEAGRTESQAAVHLSLP